MSRVMASWDLVRERSVATANPVAGASPPAITVPAGDRWLVTGFHCQAVCDATVTNRYPVFLGADSAGTCIAIALSQTPLTAGQTGDFVSNPYTPYTLRVATYMPVPFAPFELGAGGTAAFMLSGLQAGDDCGPLTVFYKRLPA